jgi:uncharacterized protein (UPF0333 family)
MRRKAQGSLEYIILIAGVVIVAAASYFLMKGFLESSKQEVNSTIGGSTNSMRADIANLENQFS